MYSFILFAIERRTPDVLYYDKAGNRRTLFRTSDISNEVYTPEMSANLSLFWLAQGLPAASGLKLPPSP